MVTLQIPSRVMFSILFILILTGCSSLGLSGSQGGYKLSDILVDPQRTVISHKIDRESFLHALDEPRALDRVRLVPMYRRGTKALPEYRLFDIQPGDPYHILGLRKGDIVRAANDWVIFDSSRFPKFISLLRYANDGMIDIFREGRALQFRYEFFPRRATTVIPRQE